MSGSDFVPTADGEFDAWLANFVAFANTNLAKLGVSAGDMGAVVATRNAWSSRYAAHGTAKATAQSARSDKDKARENVLALVRPMVRRIQATATVTNAERDALGITISDGTKTAAAVPTTAPICHIGNGERLRHVIGFRDSENPSRRSKPAGVKAVEIFFTLTPVGAPTPTDPAEFEHLAQDSATPYVVEYSGADAGKNAHYIVRWVNSRGEKGPWSEVFSAAIAA